MGCCSSAPAASQQGVSANSVSSPAPNLLKFSNKVSTARGDPSIPKNRRVTLGIVYPEETSAQAVWMFFDKTKPVEAVINGAARQGGIALDKGKLVGSPLRLNLFSLDGNVVRLDLEVEAHLGSTLHPGDVLILEKGNRIEPARLEAVRAVAHGTGR